MANLYDGRGKATQSHENAVIGKVDYMRGLTPEETFALEIVHQLSEPVGKFTRAWAARVVTEINRNKCLALCTVKIAKASEVEEVAPYFEHFLPKAPRSDQLLLGGIEGGEPIRHVHIHKRTKDEDASAG